MSEPTKNWSAGDEITASDLNTNFTEALNDYRDIVFGENIAEDDFVYLKAADGEAYKTDASFNDERIDSFIGVAKEAGTDGQTKKVQVSGVASGLAGLTAGSIYYLSDTAGEISSTAGTYERVVGLAISATQLLLRPAIKYLPTDNEKDALAGYSGIPSSANTYLTEDTIIDEDDMASDSDVNVPTQQSVKAYTDLTAVGDFLLSSDSPIASTASINPTFVKVKEIEIKKGGDIRVKFSVRLDAVAGSQAKGRIYINGAAVGTERTTPLNDDAWYTYTEDLTGLAAGDLVQIYACQTVAGSNAEIKDFQIYVEFVEVPAVVTVWTVCTIDTIYLAGSDGFVQVVIDDCGAAGGIIDGYTDSSTPPTTLRATDSAQETYHPYGGFTMPVIKGDYWEVNDDRDPVGGVTIWWVPIGNSTLR